MKRWIIGFVVVLVAVGGWFGFNRVRAQRQAQALSNLQTTPAGRGSLTASVGATGTVRANQSAILGWQTTGTVQQVNAGLGATVSADQVLATLKQSSLAQNIILAQADLTSAQRDLDNLLNSKLQQAQALKAVEDAQQALEDLQNPALSVAQAAEAIANAQKGLENAQRQLRILQSTADQTDIDAAQAQVTLTKAALDRAQDAYDPFANKNEDNLIRANLLARLSSAQQAYDAAVRTLNSLQGTASATDILVAQANVEKANAELADAQRQFERVKNGPTPADLALAEAQLADAQREYDRLKDGADPNDIAAAQSRIDAAQATIDMTRIAAPFGGTLTEVEVKPGDQVAPGTAAFRLDDLSRLLLDVQVSEVDINRIKPGQPANLSFDAILGKEYHGQVSEVALAATAEQGVVEFTVTVELTDPDTQVKPGMTAAVNIVVDQLEDVLLVPNRAVRVKDGQRVVYVLQNGQLTPVNIELGASSDTDSQVVSGDLKEGDPIVLNPPLEFEQNGPPGFIGR